jgi:hypothetical protein
VDSPEHRRNERTQTLSAGAAAYTTKALHVKFSSNCIDSQIKNGLIVNAGQAICVQGTANKPYSRMRAPARSGR